MRTIVTVIVLVLILMVSGFLLLVNPWLALTCFLVLTILFIFNGIRVTPANPPHKGMLVFLGKRQEVVLDEGWNFLPLYPIIFNLILIKVEKVNYGLSPQQVRTPDKAMISILASITWIPGIKNSPESYITYLNSGGEEGVKRVINDIIKDRTKTWAASNKDGPATWVEAQSLRDDIHEVLVKSILGDTLSRVDDEVPTNTWMRFFEKPQSEPTDYEANPRNKWAFKGKDAEGNVVWNWNGLQAIYDAKLDKDGLKEKVNQRKKDVKEIREGKGSFGDESLGITIIRFTVNEVRVEGEVAKAAELEEKERLERDADIVEIDNVSARVAMLRREHPEMSLEEAIRIVQIERGKISKSVIEVLGASTGLGQDFLGALGFQRMPGGQSGGNPSEKKGGKKKVSETTEEETKARVEKARKEFEEKYGRKPNW